MPVGVPTPRTIQAILRKTHNPVPVLETIALVLEGIQLVRLARRATRPGNPRPRAAPRASNPRPRGRDPTLPLTKRRVKPPTAAQRQFGRASREAAKRGFKPGTSEFGDAIRAFMSRLPGSGRRQTAIRGTFKTTQSRRTATLRR